VDAGETPLGCDWFDIPMHRLDERTFRITVALDEVGHFEGKCFFLTTGARYPIWPRGPNCTVNVEPADTCCFNTIYNAFVRQFGPNKYGKFAPDPSEREIIHKLDDKGYAVIPPSGKFRDLISELDFIITELGCRLIQLLPIHPTPTTYGRMGRFGSPFAALSFKSVDPALAVFDPKATPVEQFIELVDAVHSRNGKVIIDFAVNHTGWAARLHNTHPQWLVRDPEGRIEVPGAWGVQWEDLTKLDYTRKGLWRFMANVFLLWCRRGVDGFRCDAGYMVPLDAWRYIVARVREEYPDTLFFLEGLGGKISVMRDLLNRGNLNWAYSELFQNYDRNQIESYLPESIDISQSDGILVHFSETHDNNRLAARSNIFAKMRTALCALCSHSGAFGFANGVEWYATEKIDVHDAPSLNWGAEINQIDDIRRLTTLLRVHPAFFDRSELEIIQKGGGNQLVVLRHHIPSGKRLLILANLSDTQNGSAQWDPAKSGIDTTAFVDLLTGEPIHIMVNNGVADCALAPGQVRCLSADRQDLQQIENGSNTFIQIPDRIAYQQRRAKVLDVLRYYHRNQDVDGLDLDGAAAELEKDPVAFCRRQNPQSDESRVIRWQWPCDLKREVMIPPEHFLLIQADDPFCADLLTDRRTTIGHEVSLKQADGSYFALFCPRAPYREFRSLALKLTVYEKGEYRHETARILSLPESRAMSIRCTYRRRNIDRHHVFLGTNGRGAMLRAPVSWGMLNSRYDALIAANLNSNLPGDRWIMLTRCRMWVVYQGYSQEICQHCLETFHTDNDSRGIWEFQVPTGQGEHIRLGICLEMMPDENTIGLSLHREPSGEHQPMLADDKEVQIIIRPDIESRSFHDVTKAYTGPEYAFPAAVESRANGFCFAPDAVHRLQVEMPDGTFIMEPEWLYMVHRPVEAERGLDPDSDLFSPGYFSVFMKGEQYTSLWASVSEKTHRMRTSCKPVAVRYGKTAAKPHLDTILHRALDHFIVRRGPYKSIIAGYPWFLDWGRDALIVVRGMIADGRVEDARAVLKLFGQFEDRGTLPNMIQGDDAGNRDTSDAPLWFVTACSDLVRYEGNDAFLDETCGSRSIRSILVSIGKSYLSGTANGIKTDPESGLVFSPMHFSWMDTNFPAGTPRQGYPIEIQGLWFAALEFLSRIDNTGADWEKTALQVRDALPALFYLNEQGYLSDCLHAETGQAAEKAAQDDALRPNQLFALTMGAVSNPRTCRNILTACETLIVPGAIRSLAERPVQRPLSVWHQGHLLNDPHNPYQGHYVGDEDTRRKPAYHNGTAWTWVFPSFCEAWVTVYGENAKPTARSWLSSFARLVQEGCVGHVPEILDGDFPHRQRGCDAQAWGVSEALRVWHLLSA